MQEKQSRSSRLATLPGLGCLLFFAVVAIYFRAGTIAAFLVFLCLLCASSLFWSRSVLKRIELSAKAAQSGCYAGERMKLRLRVQNHSFLPLIWLDVILPAGQKGCICRAGEPEPAWFLIKGEQEAQAGIRERFVWLLWQQEIAWEEELLARKRGVVEMAGAGLQAGDGFGLSARSGFYRFPAPVRLVVYPRLVPVTVQPFLKLTQEAVARNRGQAEDITILKSIRPYQPGDSAKRINWRYLAGSGRMEVNVYETVRPGCSTFLLDLASFRRKVKREGAQGTYEELEGTEPELEQMISLAASCMHALAKQELPVALLVPEYGGREAVFCLPGEQEDNLPLCMEALAMIDYRKEEARLPYEEFWQVSHKLGTVYICTRTDREMPFEELARQLGRSRVRCLALERCQGEGGEFDWIYGETLCCGPLAQAEKEEGA